jgi:hypothetical protein
MRLDNKEILISENGNQFTTLKEIDKIAEQESKHPFVIDSVQKYGLKNDFESIKNVYNAAFRAATFFPDPDNHQYIRTLNRTLKDRRANCVDYTVFLSAFLRAMDVDHIIRMVSFDKNNPRAYSHIYPLTINGVALDAVYGQDQNGLESFKEPKERKPYFSKQVPFIGKFDKIIRA